MEATKLNKQKLISALVINIIIIVFETIGAALSIRRHGIKVFQFYTENSNYVALVVSFVFCIVGIYCLRRNLCLPSWLHHIRYVTTTCLTITLVVVLCVLTPLYPNTFIFMMFKDSNLYQHLLCPLLSIISFIVFENLYKLSFKSTLLAIIPTMFYGVCAIVLNLLKIITGPYPFFYVYVLPWNITTLALIGIVFIAFACAFLLMFIHNLIGKKSLSKAKSTYEISDKLPI